MHLPKANSNQERIRKFLQDLEAASIPKEEPRSSAESSSFPIAKHSHLDPSEDYIMAEEPRRVTLEDYSRIVTLRIICFMDYKMKTHMHT